MVVALTGSSGFVGSQLAQRFNSRGWSVVPFKRNAGSEDRTAVTFNLGDELNPEVFASHRVDALVHCAYDFHPTSWREIQRINVDGSKKLFAAAHAGGVKHVVALSTISAFEGCRSMYGRAKLEIEAAATAIRASVIRPGLVFGDDLSREGGMFGALKSSVRAKIVPVIDGGRHCQYLVHIDDLFALVNRLCEGSVDSVGKPITSASPRCWPVRDLLVILARRQGVTPRFVNVPWQAVWLGLRTAELLGLKLGYRSDSVVSLVYQDPRPDFSGLQRLGISPRDFTLV
jgi:nucleoside-diphosphate-sugar epimerase